MVQLASKRNSEGKTRISCSNPSPRFRCSSDLLRDYLGSIRFSLYSPSNGYMGGGDLVLHSPIPYVLARRLMARRCFAFLLPCLLCAILKSPSFTPSPARTPPRPHRSGRLHAVPRGRSPWEVLDLPRGSAPKAIRKRYRALVATEHPDTRMLVDEDLFGDLLSGPDFFLVILHHFHGRIHLFAKSRRSRIQGQAPGFGRRGPALCRNHGGL